MKSSLTPKGKGSKAGREVLQEGPYLMSPGGHFTQATVQGVEGFPTDNSNDVQISRQALGRSGSSNARSSAAYRPLFGGAIKVVLPESFDDVSMLRQVPDHQEVYVDKNSEMSFIVELLSFDESVSDETAADYYFRDLAQCNQANDAAVESNEIIGDPSFMPHVQSCFPKCVLIGRQAVVKFAPSEAAPVDLVQIFLIVLRLKSVGTDLLITLNAPYSQVLPQQPNEATVAKMISANSLVMPVEAAGRGSQIHAVSSIPQENFPSLQIIRQALDTFEIVDWSLFA